MLTDPMHQLLEDFICVNGEVLIRRGSPESFVDNICAAWVAKHLGCSSIDHVKRNYRHALGTVPKASEIDIRSATYLDAYKDSKSYVTGMISKLATAGRPDPSVGQFAAAVVLQRLPSSFFCAHLLYSLGHRYEGHAVARLILEQLAWAYTAEAVTEPDQLRVIAPTKAISTLKELAPSVGRLYGILSQKTHLDYREHTDFLCIINERPAILACQAQFLEYGEVMLQLADAFGAVWESSQRNFIDKLEAIKIVDGQTALRPRRRFAARMKKHLANLAKAERWFARHGKPRIAINRRNELEDCQTIQRAWRVGMISNYEITP